MVRIIDVGMITAITIHTLFSFYTDVRTRRIPNAWNLIVGLSGLFFHLVSNGQRGVLFALAGLGLMLVLSVLLQVCGAIGGGDVKWFAALGAWAGISFSLQTFIYTMLIAGAIGAGYLLFKRILFTRIHQWLTSIIYTLLMRDASHIRVSSQQAIHEIPLMIAVVPAIALVFWRMLGGG